MSKVALFAVSVCGLVAVAGTAGWLLAGRGEGTEAAAPPTEKVDPVAALVAGTLTVDAKERGVTLPPEAFQKYPPLTRVTFDRKMYPRDFKSGIACPGGGFLPLLNGVPYAYRLNRSIEINGPVPPIVGKYTDREGYEWWVHEDGSETTSRWTTITVEGNPSRTVRTDHTEPLDEKYGLGPPGDQGGSGR